MELDAIPAAASASSTATAASGQTVAHLGAALQAWLGTIHSLLDSLAHHLAKVQADAVNERVVLAQQDDEVRRVLDVVSKEPFAGAKGKGKAREDEGAGGAGKGFLGGFGRLMGGGSGGGGGGGKAKGVEGGKEDEEMEVDDEKKGGAGGGGRKGAREAKRRRGPGQ